MSEEPVIRIVVIDDHEMFLQSVVRLLQEDSRIVVVGTGDMISNARITNAGSEGLFLGAVNWIWGAGIRPEAVRLLPAGEFTPDRRAPGVVTGSVFLGNCVQVQVRLDSGEDTVAQLPRGAALFQPGDAVQLTWSAADEMTFL